MVSTVDTMGPESSATAGSATPSAASELGAADAGGLGRAYYAGENCTIFDFDDTLFPTSHVADHCPKLCQALDDDLSGPSKGKGQHFHSEIDGSAFEECTRTAAAALRLAASLGRVCVVTTASKGWVEACCRASMPQVLEAIEELGIRIFYAREAMPQSQCQKALQQGLPVGQLCKERSMTRALRKLSTKARRAAPGLGDHRTWRGVLSVGDAESERLALQDVIMGGDSSCHCKTVKFIAEPHLETLLVQLQILVAWLQRFATHDGDLDISFDRLTAEGEDLIAAK